MVSVDHHKRSSVKPYSCCRYVFSKIITVDDIMIIPIGKDLLKLFCFCQFLCGSLVLAVGVSGTCSTVKESRGWMAMVSNFNYLLLMMVNADSKESKELTFSSSYPC